MINKCNDSDGCVWVYYVLLSVIYWIRITVIVPILTILLLYAGNDLLGLEVY